MESDSTESRESGGSWRTHVAAQQPDWPDEGRCAP